jgi:zinc protease
MPGSRYRFVAEALVVLVILSPTFARTASDDPALPRDEKNVYGQFDNGLKYIVRRNVNPPGKVSLHLHVRSGAMNESERQVGLAHFLEHMAFNGSRHFKAGELIPLLNKLGMIFGADSNAHTTFHETVYKLTMPDTKPETIDLALTIFSDYAFGLDLSEQEIDEERGVILEESRSRKSAAERIQKQFLKQVFAGSRIAVHDVIGDEEQIKTFPRAEFTDYWNTWYRPENMTLIVVGDLDPQDVIARARQKLGSFQARSTARQPLGAELKLTGAPRTVLLTDPEQVGADVLLMSIQPARPRVTTVAQLRQETVESLANWIVNRRFDELRNRGGAPFREARVDTSSFINEAFTVEAVAKGEPQDWNRMLDALVAETSRAIDYGFTKRELELARSDALARAKRAVETEPTRESGHIAALLSGAVGLDRPILSAQQRLDLLETMLATVTTDELHKAFAANFKTRSFNYVITLPESSDKIQTPATDDVLAAANSAWARKTEPPEEQKLAGSILASEPDPGTVESREHDDELKLTTLTFVNGVVMHHKFSDYKKESVNVRITLPGGTIEETRDNRGISDVAGIILDRPATSRFTSSQVRDLLTGKSVRVGGGIGLDAMSISVSGPAHDLPLGMQLVHALLTDAALEQSALDDWKKQQLEHLELMKKTAEGQLVHAMAETVFGGDARFMPLTAQQIQRQERSPAEAWFKRIANHAAIEVAVVGDIQLDEAAALVAKYLGSLPKRTGDFTTLDPLRKLSRGGGPFEKTVRFASITPKAMVLAGFVSCDELDPRRRALSLAALVVSERMNQRIREKEQLVYSIDAHNTPGRGIPGTGMMMAAAPTRPESAQKLGDVVIQMFREFAKTGPTDAELDVAKKQIANLLETQLKQPEFWAGQLADLRCRQKPLSDLKQLPTIFQTFSPDQVRDAVNNFLKDDSVIKLLIVPETTASPTTAPVEVR